MPRIVFISDTHLQQGFSVPDGDILVHSGDLTGRGTFQEVAKALHWFGKFPHRHKIAIAGNHDWLFEKDPGIARGLVPEGVTYLEAQEVTIEGLRFWGSPYTPEFFSWAFNLDRATGELEAKWAQIPEGIDVLITHGPAWGILDKLPDHSDRMGKHVGCSALRERLKTLKPKVHAFGHIHCGQGLQTVDGTTYVNASICDEAYKPTNKPISLFIDP